MMNVSLSISSEPSSQKLPFPEWKGEFLFSVHAPRRARRFHLWSGILCFRLQLTPYRKGGRFYGLHRPHGVYPADTASSLELNWI